MGRRVTVPKIPLRIISLVPSQTELLYDLGLNEEIIAQTIFCIHPNNQFQNKPKIGGTKKLNIEKIKSLNPDLIIGNKEENEQSQIEELEKHFPVWMSDIYTIDDAVQMIQQLGIIVNKNEEAIRISKQIISGFDSLIVAKRPFVFLYFIWRNPWMIAGNHTFINHIFTRMGLVNAGNPLNGRYPIIEIENFNCESVQYIFLSSEPYPFKEKHIQELQGYFTQAKIIIVDGESFSWYGSRLLKSLDYFNEFIKKCI